MCSLNLISQTSTTDPGVVINGVKWATRNVDRPGTFATKPETAGMFYQWNRKIGWSATNPTINSSGGTTWNNNTPTGTIWSKANDPSPAGWRVPTREEILKLLDKDKVRSEWTTVNGITGRKFTDKTTGKFLFLPAAGFRYCEGGYGTIEGAGWGSNYWSSTQRDSRVAFELYFNNDSVGEGVFDLCDGLLIRSVAE